MRPELQEPPPTILIGPGLDEPGPTRPQEPCADPPQIEGRKLLLRLVIAFFLVVVIAVVCFVFLPRAGLYVPPWVPLAAFAAIAVGVLVNASAEGQLPSPPAEEDGPTGCGCGDGRPVGCCPGPRPPRFLRDEPKRR